MTDAIRSKIIWWALCVLLITVVGYGLFRVYPFVVGPEVIIYSPLDGEKVASSTFIVRGKAKRIKEITLQGRPITIDTEGLFTETLVLHSPYTILVVEATDTYGKKVQKVLQVSPSEEFISQ